jgi:hypothetical protein
MRRGGLLAAGILGILLVMSISATAAAPRSYVWLGGYWIDEHQKYGWSYFVQRPGPPEGTGSHGGQRPCISVAAVTREGSSLRVNDNEFCYGIPHFLSAESEPLIVNNTVFSNDKGSATAFGVAASHAARYLKLTLDHGYRTIRLHELNPAQARKTRLRPFRHAGFLMRGHWCIEQFVVLNGAKKVLWDSGSEPCGLEEAAGRWRP